MITTQLSIGPGAIAEPSQEGGPAFALSSSEWYSIQAYVTDALSKEIMPHTITDFRAYLGSCAPENLSDFEPLIKAYDDIFNHVTTWNEDTFPKSISLASDIVAYASQAETYYAPLIPLADALTENPDDEKSKEKLTAILDVLIKQTDSYRAQAEEVSKQIREFANQTKQDSITLSGPDGESGLYKYYSDEYGETSEDVKRLTKEIEDQKAILNAANKEYDHDVVVAATSPSYAWVFPVGTIAASVVAGIYGDKATKALKRAKAAQAEIDALEAELQVNANLMKSLTISNQGLSENINSINGALPIIQKIQGVWGAISDDLTNIKELVIKNIAEALPIIVSLGVDSAIKQWKAVGKEADAYRVNAYITVEQEAA